eukprot:5673870-Karenia_brevis.AAC.1
MFDEVLDIVEREWSMLGLGFFLPESKRRISSATWVDNCFIFAADIEQYKYMARTLTSALLDRYGWRWKDDSLEVLPIQVDHDIEELVVQVSGEELRYKIVDSMVALGGKLANQKPDESLLQYRIMKADKAFQKFRRHLTGKAPVSSALDSELVDGNGAMGAKASTTGL